LVSAIAYLDLERMGADTLVVAPSVRGSSQDAVALVVRGDSDVRTLDGLRGRRVVLPPDALAGRPFVRWLFKERAEKPDEFFASIGEASAQDANLTLVVQGRADATAVRRSAISAWPEGTFRVVAESPAFGLSPIVARNGLDPATVAQIRQSLLTLEERDAVLAGSVISGFTVVDADDYEFARDLYQSGDAAGRQ
jgi:ABC-type phosphate/phosphonate transport system substrate-binding protein